MEYVSLFKPMQLADRHRERREAKGGDVGGAIE
jgi:hypothetical protein